MRILHAAVQVLLDELTASTEHTQRTHIDTKCKLQELFENVSASTINRYLPPKKAELIQHLEVWVFYL